MTKIPTFFDELYHVYSIKELNLAILNDFMQIFLHFI
jgi:hypothetical protein